MCNGFFYYIIIDICYFSICNIYNIRVDCFFCDFYGKNFLIRLLLCMLVIIMLVIIILEVGK